MGWPVVHMGKERAYPVSMSIQMPHLFGSHFEWAHPACIIQTDQIFKFDIPIALEGVAAKVLDIHSNWEDPE
jgi:ATP-dependent phosphoenolpyruvate carboxykinase